MNNISQSSFFSTIYEMVRFWAEATPDSIAIRDAEEREWTFSQVLALVESGIAYLSAAGVENRDRIAVVLPNGPAAAISFLAVSSSAAAAPLNPQLKKAEFEFYLADLQARAMIVAADDVTEAPAAARNLNIPVIRLPWREGDSVGAVSLFDRDAVFRSDSVAGEHDVALILHTSGTTARPKMVPLSHTNLCRSAFNVASTLSLDRRDSCLNVMPLFHIHGIVAALLASLHAGAQIVCSPGFLAPRFFDWLDRCRPTWYTAVPTMHQAILSRVGTSERDIISDGCLRLIRSSSASLAPALLTRIEEEFGVPVIEAYGMSEAAHQICSNPLPPAQRKPASVGIAAGPSVAIADDSGRQLPAGEVGEVIIRGPNVTLGYLGRPIEASGFTEDGWFRTGDQGYLDESGYLYLTGRLKEIINRGGETIAPREIDEALLDHPSVLQAVAFSVPDERLGEEVAAAVVPRAGEKISADELQTFAAERLSFAKVPKLIVILDEIPKGPTGKLQRIGLAEKLNVSRIPESTSAASSGDNQATEIERIVASIWKDVLQCDEVDPDRTFVDAGGDSVTATQLVLRLRESFAVDIPLIALFNEPTIRQQARLIDSLQRDAKQTG